MTTTTPQADARHLVVTSAADGERLDRYVQSQCADFSRSRVAALARAGHVTLNGATAKPASLVHAGDAVEVVVPAPIPLDLVAQDIPITVVYQDAQLLVVDKPAGLPVHPGPGHPDRTLVNALLAMVPDLAGIGGTMRPGIVHRLDKDTSGLMIVAKTDAAHRSLSAQLKERRVKKTYVALVDGAVKRDEGEIDGSIARHPVHRQRMAIVKGGRDARTRYAVVKRYAAHTLVEAYPVTGRTHQIRVHFASLGHPLVGDAVYGKRSPLVERHFLHAARLGFWLAPEEAELREFESPLPDDLLAALAALGEGRYFPSSDNLSL
jgi:23S rRNA pseudouridine1911/1915/1917 synthase